MIQHIKILFYLFLFLSCKKNETIKKDLSNVQNITIPSEKQISTKIKENEEKLVFSFFKSFPFCDNDSGYFTKEEADLLYKKNTIDITNINSTIINFSELLSKELENCVIEKLSIKGETVFEEVATGLEDPLNTLYLINKKYLLTFRDGYFFIFHIYVQLHF